MKKRAFDRIPAGLKVKFSLGNEIIAGTVNNISDNGMFINTSTCVPPKTPFDLFIHQGEEILKVPVAVSRLIKTGEVYNGMGVKVVNPPKQYYQLLAELKWRQIKKPESDKSRARIYVCRVCQHIEFDEAPLHCPFCKNPIDNFIENTQALHSPDDFASFGEFEKKHFPVITVSKEYGPSQDYRSVDVHVKVGEIEHDAAADDRIMFLDFYFNEFNVNKICVARFNLNCKKMKPEASIRLNNIASGILTVINNCNAHGSWMKKINI